MRLYTEPLRVYSCGHNRRQGATFARAKSSRSEARKGGLGRVDWDEQLGRACPDPYPHRETGPDVTTRGLAADVGPNFDTTGRRKYANQHEPSSSMTYTMRSDTVVTALVEAIEERWVKLMSKSLYLPSPDGYSGVWA